MFGWLPYLPVVWIALVVLAGMALLTAAIYAVVMLLAESERAVSGSSINTVKWTGLVALALLALCAIALVHSGNRITARVAMGVFAAAVAVVITISRHRMSRSRGSSVLILTR